MVTKISAAMSERQANAQPGIYEHDWEEFWETEGRERLTWFEPFSRLYEWEPPYAKWYLGGKLNVCFNCVDRHVEAGNGGRVAYYWEGEPEDERRTITFSDLQREVVRFANGALASVVASNSQRPGLHARIAAAAVSLGDAPLPRGRAPRARARRRDRLYTRGIGPRTPTRPAAPPTGDPARARAAGPSARRSRRRCR